MASKTDPAAILARFPGPVTLTPSPRKWLLVLGGCLAFVAIGIWQAGEQPLIGWSAVGFFGLGVLVAGAMLVPGAAGIVLDADGFEVTGFFRRHRTRWADATGFQAATVPPSAQKLVVYDDRGSENSTLGGINRRLSGRNSGLPDNYGLPPDDLAQVMMRWRERAVPTR